MYDEEDFVPLSALSHLVYCARRVGLIHLEQQWAENRLTAEGRVLHERADMDMTEVRGDLRVAHGLRIHSARLGLAGRADVVEFRKNTNYELQITNGATRNIPPDLPSKGESEKLSSLPPAASGLASAVALHGVAGMWTVAPVEYKRGKPKKDLSDKVQLCAQGLCLEEMLGVAVPVGLLYYGKTRRRVEVALDAALRAETEVLVGRLHELMDAGATPPPEPGPKCDQCSLKEVCMPEAMARRSSVRRYLTRALTAGDEPE